MIPAGREAAQIAGLYALMFWTFAAVFAGVLAFLVVSLTRRLRGETAEGTRRRSRAVAAATGASAVILVALLAASVSTGRSVVEPAGGEALEIRLVGHQWWWEVLYPGLSPSENVTTANEIHVPVGRPVRLLLSSGDVIHSFWAPSIHGKTDLIPGRSTTQVFHADRAGVFTGQCAEFCGLQHAHMGFLVIAEPPDRFDAWMRHQRLPAVERDEPGPRRGRDVFFRSSCVLCHSIRRGETEADAFGHEAPDLTHLASRATIAAGTFPNSTGHLAGWVVDPQRMKPGNRMPPNTLASEDLLDLVSYLRSLE